MKSQARVDPWNHPAQPLYFSVLERLTSFAQSPQWKKLVREAWNGISASCLGHQGLFHYNSVGKEYLFLVPILIDWWRLPGARLWGFCALSRLVGQESGDQVEKATVGGEGECRRSCCPLQLCVCKSQPCSLPPPFLTWCPRRLPVSMF